MKKALLVLFFIALTSCSLFSSRTPSALEKLALQNFANQYMRNIIIGNVNHVESMINWPIYARGNDRNPDTVKSQIVNLKGLSTSSPHPLLGFQVKKVEIGEIHGLIGLTRPDNTELELKFQWQGRGWMVSDDTLFGKGGLVEKLVQEKS